MSKSHQQILVSPSANGGFVIHRYKDANNTEDCETYVAESNKKCSSILTGLICMLHHDQD